MITDIRLQHRPFIINNKEYDLCCNMNVLADVQNTYGGDLAPALEGSLKAVLTFLAAMINESNSACGNGERFTVEQIGRMIHPSRMGEVRTTVVSLVSAALVLPDKSEESGSERKNPVTTPVE